MSKGLLFSLSFSLGVSLTIEMLPRHRAAAAASSWLKHPMASPPESPLWERRDANIHIGNPGAPIQMPASLHHQLNLSLFCPATKRWSPRSPTCPPTPQPSLSPSHFSLSCTGACAQLPFKQNTRRIKRPGRSESQERHTCHRQ